MSNPVPSTQTNTAIVSAPSKQVPSTPLPCEQALLQASRLAIELDRAIHLDYYVSTFNKTAVIGEDEETKDKMLVKSREEYTSSISKIYKVQTDYIILTENSIYIVSGNVQKRKIALSSLLGNDM